ncbi:MAG TPA: thiolase family protein [Mycobacterium sp.]|jgi:acetyl-CoA acetyltransferase|nr:thiolase family protein [Mycobacterium sp.]
MTTAAAIIGVGMTPFGRFPQRSLKGLGGEAVHAALADASMSPADIDMAFVANAMASIVTGQVSIVGQTVLRDNGFSGIPVYNIDNACAGSSSALNLAVHAVRAGAATRVLVLGVEKLFARSRETTYAALNGAADIDFVAESGVDATRESVFVAAVYPPRLREYADRHGLSADTLAAVAVKNRSHAGLNPMAQYRQPLTAKEVLAARSVVEPITALMCAPISDGATAVVVTAGVSVRPEHRPVWIRGSAVGMAAAGRQGSTIGGVARRAYADAGITPHQVSVAEVHDSIAFNELVAYEELGFCDPGAGARLVADGLTSLGGQLPVNTSGGLESRGHPVAATGLAQVIELAHQLRGEAGGRQVPDAQIGVAENAGGYAGGDTAAVAVTVLGRTAADD